MKPQQWIGVNDVRMQPVYFNVQRTTPFSDYDTPVYSPVPFYLELLNVGNYMKHHHWRLRIEKAWTLILLLFRTRPFPGNNIKYRNLTEIRHVHHLQRWSILRNRSGRV
jgi:hypothetical protein